ASFQPADAPFVPGPPVSATPQPALPFVCHALRRLRAWFWQHHPHKVSLLMTSYVDKPEHAHRLIKRAKAILPGDREREQTLLPRVRRSGIQQGAIASLDYPPPDADEPQIYQTHQHNQAIKPLVLGDVGLAQFEAAALPIPEHRLDPH